MGNPMKIFKFIDKLQETPYKKKNLVLILAAGFEERDLSIIEIIKAVAIPIKKIIVLDYENIEQNEPVRSKVINMARSISAAVKTVKVGELPNLLTHIEILENDMLIIDITGMSRIIIFQILNQIDKAKISYNIAYTEAEEYFPLKGLYDTLIANQASEEVAFTRYLETEKAEFVYSYDCSIIQPPEFMGNPEPGRPAMILAFFTFKRSRLQAILQVLEIEKRVLILSEPVRQDLKWRKDFMKIANLDIIQKNEPDVNILGTLDAFQLMDFFEDKIYRNKEYTKYNLILAPLGSKMQTIGSYLFWRKHSEISVLFSQPGSYFKDAYSKGYRDTFIITAETLEKTIS
jgi:hypothetical protein